MATRPLLTNGPTASPFSPKPGSDHNTMRRLGLPIALGSNADFQPAIALGLQPSALVSHGRPSPEDTCVWNWLLECLYPPLALGPSNGGCDGASHALKELIFVSSSFNTFPDFACTLRHHHRLGRAVGDCALFPFFIGAIKSETGDILHGEQQALLLAIPTLAARLLNKRVLREAIELIPLLQRRPAEVSRAGDACARSPDTPRPLLAFLCDGG